MKEICLITGGAGFIGCAVAPLLIEKYHVIVMDSLHPQIHASHDRPAMLHEEVDFILGDITIPEAWDRLLSAKRPSLIIHLAAETGTGQSLTEGSRHALTNVVGTTQMLDALVRKQVFPHTIFLSSSRAVYGEGAWKRSNGDIYYPGQRTQNQLEQSKWDFEGSKFLPSSSTENRPSPTSIYGATKLAQEHILKSWAYSFNVRPVISRFQNVYGVGQSLINSYTGIVSLFVRIAKEGKSIPLYEDGEMLRDFIYIDDVATSILAAIEGASDIISDIGTGTSSTIADIATIISKRYHAPELHVCGKFRNGDVRHAGCNITETLKSIDWKPKVSLEAGLEKLCGWIDEKVA